MPLITFFAEAVDPQQVDLSTLPRVAGGSSPINTIVEIVFGLLGSLALLFIILAGIKLMTSKGDPQAVAKARNTIIYAALGLAITISAFTIVTFVLGQI